VGTVARALLASIMQLLIVTFNMSKAATAPPQVEHGWLVSLASLGQPLNPPLAELPKKELWRTLRNRPWLGPKGAIAAIAPPLAALQLIKLHRDTSTLLPYAATAPPLEFGLKQFLKEIPVMATEELMMRKAAPVLIKRPLQLKSVAEGTPLMTSDAILLMLTVDSIKTPGLRLTLEALMFWMAKAMVLHGVAACPQLLESVPSRGLTLTEVIVVARADGNAVAMKQKAEIDMIRIAAWNW
jgi:hypothetical protein